MRHALLALFALTLGCFDARARDTDARSDGGTTPALDAPPPTPTDASDPPPSVRLVFLLASIDIPELGPTGLDVFGFDLDGMVSDGTGPNCDDEEDFVSRVTGARGVDNQFAGYLAPLLLSMPDGSFAEAARFGLATGTWIVVLEVTGVESTASDPSVSAAAFRARPTSGSLAIGTDGRPAPGQRLTAVEPLGTGSGSIVGGRLRITLPRLPLPFGPGGVVDLTDVVLGADVGSGLTRGEGGGETSIPELVRGIEALGVSGIDEATVRAVTNPDLRPTADPTICDGISAGFGFDAVPADLMR